LAGAFSTFGGLCGEREVKLIGRQTKLMEEILERCLKCGTQQGLNGVAVTIGRRTFHLFYLCGKCGDVGIEELLKIIRGYGEKGTTWF
jgi:hypothetical protein